MTDENTAIAYAHVCEAIDNWDSLLNIIYDTLLEEDVLHENRSGRRK